MISEGVFSQLAADSYRVSTCRQSWTVTALYTVYLHGYSFVVLVALRILLLASLFILCATPLPLAYALPSPRMLAAVGMCGTPLSPYSTRVPNSTRNAASNRRRKSGNHNSLKLNAIAVKPLSVKRRRQLNSFPGHLMGGLGTSPQLVSQARPT